MIRPTAYFRVHSPIISPLVARPGEFIALWLAHPDQTVSVIAVDRSGTLQTGNPPLAAVTDDLRRLCAAGVISGLAASDAALLQAPRAAA